MYCYIILKQQYVDGKVSSQFLPDIYAKSQGLSKCKAQVPMYVHNIFIRTDSKQK